MPLMMTITTSTTRTLDEAEEVAGAGISMHLIVSNKLRWQFQAKENYELGGCLSYN